MKVPVPCFKCKTFTMEMDMSRDHQHLECQTCGTTWCVQCKQIDVDPQWLDEVRNVQALSSKAHLN